MLKQTWKWPPSALRYAYHLVMKVLNFFKNFFFWLDIAKTACLIIS